MKCVICNRDAPYMMIHKEDGKIYPICSHCVSNKYYNEEVFYVGENTDGGKYNDKT